MRSDSKNPAADPPQPFACPLEAPVEGAKDPEYVELSEMEQRSLHKSLYKSYAVAPAETGGIFDAVDASVCMIHDETLNQDTVSLTKGDNICPAPGTTLLPLVAVAAMTGDEKQQNSCSDGWSAAGFLRSERLTRLYGYPGNNKDFSPDFCGRPFRDSCRE